MKRTRGRFENIAARPKDDTVYHPKTLCALAARATAKIASLPQLSASVQQLVDEAVQDDDDCVSMLQDRVNPSVGDFAHFEMFRNESCDSMFSVNLRRSARHLLQFLELTDSVPVTDASYGDRYLRYFELQSTMRPSKKLFLPPPDVAKVHLAHMLQSKEYHLHALSFNLIKLAHCATWMFDGLLEELEDESNSFWNSVCGDLENDSYSFHGTWKSLFELNHLERESIDSDSRVPICGVDAFDSRIQISGKSFDSNRPIPYSNLPPINQCPKKSFVFEESQKMWLDSFRSKFGARLDLILDDQFEMRNFQIRYQKYLYLLTKYPQTMEWMAHPPSLEIDLFWHAHLLHHHQYLRDMSRLCFYIPHHNVLPEGARCNFVYDEHATAAAQLWREEYFEEL